MGTPLRCPGIEGGAGYAGPADTISLIFRAIALERASPFDETPNP